MGIRSKYSRFEIYSNAVEADFGSNGDYTLMRGTEEELLTLLKRAIQDGEPSEYGTNRDWEEVERVIEKLESRNRPPAKGIFKF